MNKELKQKWVEALRSGKYKQGKEALRRCEPEESFCCLGVLCDIVDPHNWELVDLGDIYTHKGKSGYPDREIARSVGLDDQFITNLAMANDNGKSFEQIAARIEAEL